ncbi:MAG: hypothetical protein F4X11_22045 [Acidobacteria bacterium]|nr:hypothetical protein [Acidobacteriota bacterium]
MERGNRARDAPARGARPANGFQRAEDRTFCAFHLATGEQLFRHAAPRPIRSSRMTDEVNGKQYVTVIATTRC